MTTDEIIDGVLAREGSTFTNSPADRGGPTKYGITIGDLHAWRRAPVTAADVEVMTENEARAIYVEKYVRRPGFADLADDWLRSFMVDTAVLEGVTAAIRMLQAVVCETTDGVLGPKTLAAANAMPPCTLKKWLVTQRMHHLIGVGLSRVPKSVVDTTDLTWLHGWWNRVASFL